MDYTRTVFSEDREWIDNLTSFPYEKDTTPNIPAFELISQQQEPLQINRSVIKTPMKIGTKDYSRGLGAHSNGRMRVTSQIPIKRFYASVGIDCHDGTRDGSGSVIFRVESEDGVLHETGIKRGGEEADVLDVDCGNARSIELVTDNADGDIAWDHADWADAKVVLQDDSVYWVDELPRDLFPIRKSRYPFSFTCQGKHSDDLLAGFELSVEESEKPEAKITQYVWKSSDSPLEVSLTIRCFTGYPAADWVMHFENTGDRDTGIIENVRVCDISIFPAAGKETPFKVHYSRGGTPDPTHFKPYESVVTEKSPLTLDTSSGRSSTAFLPFFAVESGAGSVVSALGWSGHWTAGFECVNKENLRMHAGMHSTHFRLYPGEKVRTPSVLVLTHMGDIYESTSLFRRLLNDHFVARREGKAPMPLAFCNTCFTRGGAWLNECNEKNQISLIEAYAKLGAEAIITDAGWFTGGWPHGAGNWDVRKDAYPNGMAPVAKAAEDEGIVYGLWFEPERVVKGTDIHKNHPDWCLADNDEPTTFLLDFGIKEARDHFLDIVNDYMQLAGFSVYRQDFNADPVTFWRYNESPDRLGIVEMKYIEGLYDYWDKLREAWPDALMEECAGGGHRLDLETIKRLPITQKTDYWFDYESDQSAIFGASVFLPNNCIVAHLNTLNEYDFHSTMASSLCLGWIADAKDFDFTRAKGLLDIYNGVRHLLTGGFYPLLPYTLDKDKWMAMQFTREDLGEGMVLAFRRSESPYESVVLNLRAIEPDAKYEVSFTTSGAKKEVSGEELANGLTVTLPEKRSSEMVLYRKV